MADKSFLFALGKNTFDALGAFQAQYSEFSNTNLAATIQSGAFGQQIKNVWSQYRRQALMDSEMYAQENWNTAQNAAIFQGSQSAATAASGFAVSTGERRLFADTFNRMDARISGNNRTLQLKTNNAQLAAMLEESRLRAMANAQDRIRKRSSGLRAFIPSALSALGSFASGAVQLGLGKMWATKAGPNVAPIAPVAQQWTGDFTGGSLNMNKLSLGYGQQTLLGAGGF